MRDVTTSLVHCRMCGIGYTFSAHGAVCNPCGDGSRISAYKAVFQFHDDGSTQKMRKEIKEGHGVCKHCGGVADLDSKGGRVVYPGFQMGVATQCSRCFRNKAYSSSAVGAGKGSILLGPAAKNWRRG